MYFASLSIPAKTHHTLHETTRRYTATGAARIFSPKMKEGGRENSFTELRFRRLKYFYDSYFAYKNNSF
jgi:hypothetical protein